MNSDQTISDAAWDKYPANISQSYLSEELDPAPLNEASAKAADNARVAFKKKFQNIIKFDAESKLNRQPVAGRNAFEIRENIIGKAMDIVEWSQIDKNNPDNISDKVLTIAEKLYRFVENKSH